MASFLWGNQNIFYREAGSGQSILIIPGSTASSIYHQADIDRLSQADTQQNIPGYRAISFDWPGTGQSDRLETWHPRWLEKVADCGHGLLSALGARPAVVMGTSGGAMTALLMAIRHPESVRALIIDSTPLEWTAQLLRNSVAGRSPVTKDMAAFWQQAHGEDWQRVVDQDSQAMLAFAERGDDWIQGRLNQINCPVLLTGSLQDDLVPNLGEQMLKIANQIPGSSLFLYNEGGHPFMWSQSELFYQQIQLFLKNLEKRA